jgi:pimeloyl-ACP methyl ester carboxylesterase
MQLAKHRLPGLVLTDHEFKVPLDHSDPGGPTIVVFAREVVAPTREKDYLPWLVFFQGGPGGASPRPTDRSAWLGRALLDYRVLLLDQRGTGRSTPVNRHTLDTIGPLEVQARYLRLHRADSIVRDAERIRSELTDGAPWSVLGQSFGGFCVTTYLSLAPEGIREAFVTGGLPPLKASAEDVYRATYPRVLDRNRRYYERYPVDEGRASRVMARLRSAPQHLPGGDVLTARRFQALGMAFGMSDGFERLHYLLDEAFTGDELADRFLIGVESATTFATGPLYAVLQEPIYCQGSAARWSAERVRSEHPEFDAEPGGRVYFTGEMIFPWMFEEHAALRPFQEVAELLAQQEDWPALYDVERLRTNRVPCAAAIYYDDMYVDAGFSLDAARNICGLRTWITNEYEHDASRRDGANVLGRLIDLVRGDR